MTITYRYLFAIFSSIFIFFLLQNVWISRRKYYFTIFPIRTVKVIGTFPQKLKMPLENIILPLTKKSVLSSSDKELRDCIKRLSWVETVKTRYQLPYTLLVYIDARKPIARFDTYDKDNKRKMYFIDQQGVIFDLYTNDYTFLPLLIGTMSQSKILINYYQKIQKMLQTSALSIHSIKLDDQTRVYLVLDNGILLKLGSFDPLTRLQTLFKNHLNILHQSHKINAIDLRYSKGMAVQFYQSAR